MKRRLKRQRDKVPAGSAAAAAAGAQTASGDGVDALATTADEFGVLIPLRAHHKIRSFCFAPVWPFVFHTAVFSWRIDGDRNWFIAVQPGSVVTPADASADVVHDRLLLALTSNALHVYDVAVSEKCSEKVWYASSHTVPTRDRVSRAWVLPRTTRHPTCDHIRWSCRAIVPPCGP